MNSTKQLRDRLLRMFPVETHSNIQPVLDAIINSAKRDGIMQGRQEAAAMIEVLVLGDANLDIETLTETLATLRNEANTRQS